ncbi:MAG: hypothetical protein ACYTHM_25600, partial [Planctomycetota bacterium]
FGGSNYPASLARPSIYIQDENLAASPNDMRFHHLTVDRTAPGETNLDFISHVQIHGDFQVLDGHLASPLTRRLAFRGPTPALWAVHEGGPGRTSFTNIQPDLDGKTGPLTLCSSAFVPGFTVSNPNPGFELRIDNQGAVAGSIALLDGRLVVDHGDLEVRGTFRVGRSNPPLPPSNAPRLDFAGTGTLYVSAFFGGPDHGDFLFEEGAAGSMNQGRIWAEGDFRVDNAAFAAGGTHMVELSGNVGRSVDILNLQTPSGKPVPTLLLQNFTVAKTGSAPGDLVEVRSEIDIRGTFTHVSGRMNWNNANVGSLALAPGPGNPPGADIVPGEKDRAVLQFQVATDSQEAVRVTRISVTALSSGNAAADIAGARLYLDSDGDDVFNPGADLPVAGLSYFASGRCDFALSRVLQPMETESWFLVISLYDTASVGSTFCFVIGGTNDVQGAGLTSNRAAHVTGVPVGSGEFTVAEAPPEDPAPSGGGSCGGGTAPGGPGNPLGCALLFLAFTGLCILSKRRNRPGHDGRILNEVGRRTPGAFRDPPMKTTHGFTAVTVLAFAGLFLTLPAAPAEAGQYRTQGFSTAWFTWNQPGAWQVWTGTTWVTSSPPGPNDTAWIQCQIRIPQGVTATVGTLYVGCNNAAGGLGMGWYYHGPGVTGANREHELEVHGTLNVNLDLYVVDDVLDIQSTGVVNVTGLMHVGLVSGYVFASTGPQLNARRAAEPTLEMNGGTLNVRYGSTLGTPSHAGGVIFWPGSRELLHSGAIHVEGWFVGAEDWGSTPMRLFDLSGGTTHIYMDGAGYPPGWTANALTWDENYG